MVLKDGQPIEKGRLVVNGARIFDGKCLNDYLEVGPNLMNDLSDILLFLRRQKWVKKMTKKCNHSLVQD